MMEYVVTLDDINQELMCTVSTTNPVFSTQATTVLHVQGMYNILGILWLCILLCKLVNWFWWSFSQLYVFI